MLRDDLKKAYLITFGTPSGRIVFEHLKERNLIGRSAFNPDSHRQTDFNLGRQRAIQEILDMMETEEHGSDSNRHNRN